MSREEQKKDQNTGNKEAKPSLVSHEERKNANGGESEVQTAQRHPFMKFKQSVPVEILI